MAVAGPSPGPTAEPRGVDGTVAASGVVKARPFVPFAVTLSSGRVVNVTGPEMIILGRRWDTVAFVDEQGDDRHVIMPHDHIASVNVYASV